MSNKLPENRVHFKDLQLEFSSYIRDPKANPLPAGVKKQRMAMYRELFFNNINSFLISNFPVLHEILDTKHWQALAQDFFARHPCKTPYFSEIPEEFLIYLQEERNSNNDDPPFMLELAHYEWVEMAISIAKQQAPEISTTLLDSPLDQEIALSPLAWPLVYRYPVQKMSPQFQPEQPPQQPTYLVVYRNKDDAVIFIEITPLTFRLLQIIEENETLSVLSCIDQITTECPSPDSETIKEGAVQIIKEMADRGILYTPL